MSVSHPYLKQLRIYVQQFIEVNGAVTDRNPTVYHCCRLLEDIFKNGLQPNGMVGKPASAGIFQWISSLPVLYSIGELTGQLHIAINNVVNNRKVCSDIGKVRYFIRLALNEKLLKRTVILLRKKRQLLRHYYDEFSIFGDEILSEILIARLALLENEDIVKFQLDVKNSPFLDDTWLLPYIKKYEFVPCDRLGLVFKEVDERIIVTEVLPGSPADEDLRIEPGDIIDELFGETLRNVGVRRVTDLMSTYKGCPIYINVIKAIDNHGSFYPPLSAYSFKAGLQRDTLLDGRDRRMREFKANGEPDPFGNSEADEADAVCERYRREKAKQERVQKLLKEKGSFSYYAQYLGNVSVGRIGTVEGIEEGVISVIKSSTERQDVIVSLTEIEVIVFDLQSNKVIFRHGFPEIGSCGRRIDYPKNFSYIAGETTCNIAKEFYCYVFETNTVEEAVAVLKEISNGFKRTHWAV